ncbi:hypothetical protein SmJEL517_g00269 [Synchytrium microbalum]|uniref:Chitin-binding type-4 domain-containing protein n=1 Tax=Synchytrium microbalum TaxID=1806994 RepID=A0A507CEU9_9FUNG|nr:uncharacterized protein SmJEL517_g00269 [Synchytrium microbalum]TPX38152.1 hypothetical protein SmJEL517_g00269 [Synchytrium microbalum]
MKVTVSVVAILAALPAAFGHMAMSIPAVRGYPNKVQPYDYSITSPLDSTGTRIYPCQGKAQGPPVATLIPGSYVSVEIAGGARHNGGHCQWSISYDGGANFVVLDTIIRDCLSPASSSNTYDYQVPLPADLPGSPNAIFAWSWINSIGNREYYMNCADVAISGSSTGSLTGPRLFVANLPGTPTVPEFPTADSNDSSQYFASRDIIRVSPATPGAQVITSGGSGSNTVQSAGPVSAPAQSAGPVSSQASPVVAVASPQASAAPVAQQSPDVTQPQASAGAGTPVASAVTPVASAVVSAPSPTVYSSDGQCTVGNMQCVGLYQFATCAPAFGGGGTLVVRPVAPGTICKQVGSSIIMDFA